MIDLNNPDTYQIVDFGGGNQLYQDASTQQYYDPSDLSTPLATSDVQAYGAPINSSGAISTGGGGQSTQSTYHAPTPSPTVNSPSQGGVSTAGMTGMFTSIGSAFASLVNPPKNTPGGVPLVYSAATGGYVPASQAAGVGLSGAASNITMWLVLGVALVVGVMVLRPRRAV